MIERIVHKEFGRVVSSLQLYVVELPSRKLAVIEEVFTDEQFRGKGYASKLIEQAINRARELGCDCVELNCREELVAYYEKFGFV